MSSSMHNFMEAYAAVHNPQARKEFYSNRDPISEMNTASLTDNDLREIAEEICEELFAQGYGIQEAADVLSDVLAEGENSGRNAKISRLFDAFAETFNRIQSKANQLEAFAEYRNSKRLQETWSARFNQEKRIKRHHGALVAEHVAGVKRGLLQMVELYKGKHGQSDKEYADSRSQGGKMVSGDSKQSGAEYTHGRRVKAANPGMQPDVGGKTKPKSQGKMDRGTRADLEYRRANLAKKEEVEQYVDFLIDEGYDCSELTWEEITEEYETLDEGLRSAVKRLLGKKDAPAEKKPESRGEQLRKKYNVGPEKSDTSAKRQILNRTRARKERDEREYGGSHYSKSVAKKSADAHDRYLRAGYSKYGADDRRGSGNKARKRAAALRQEDYVNEGKKAKPDYLDFDGDGDEKESMKKALKDKKRMKEQLELSGKFSAKEIEELIEKL